MSRGQRLHRLGLASVRKPPRANLFRSVCLRVSVRRGHGSQSRGYRSRADPSAHVLPTFALAKREYCLKLTIEF
jgi:hypothetical protein